MPKKPIKVHKVTSVDELMQHLANSAGSANKTDAQPEDVAHHRLVRAPSPALRGWKDIVDALEARPGDELCAWAAQVIRAYRIKDQRRADAERRSNEKLTRGHESELCNQKEQPK